MKSQFRSNGILSERVFTHLEGHPVTLVGNDFVVVLNIRKHSGAGYFCVAGSRHSLWANDTADHPVRGSVIFETDDGHPASLTFRGTLSRNDTATRVQQWEERPALHRAGFLAAEVARTSGVDLASVFMEMATNPGFLESPRLKSPPDAWTVRAIRLHKLDLVVVGPGRFNRMESRDVR